MTPYQLGSYFAFAMLAVIYIFGAWLMGRIFDKFNEAKWAAWIPLYNLGVFYRIAGLYGKFAFFYVIGWVITAIILAMNTTALTLGTIPVTDPSFYISALIIIVLCNILTTIFTLVACYRIPRELGKPYPGLWFLLALFSPALWLIILGFDSSRPAWNPDAYAPSIYLPVYTSTLN